MLHCPQKLTRTLVYCGAVFTASLGTALAADPHFQPAEAALGSVTHLCVAAHQDDIEIMAYDGICDCLDVPGKRFGGVVFRDLQMSHPEYRCVAKEFAVESHFHEYLTYVSTAPGRTERFAAALNTEAAASPEELEAYRAIVGSLVLFAAEP